MQEVPCPIPGPDELLVSVESCGVNYPDLLLIRDSHQSHISRPFSPGSEVAGTVALVGRNVQGFEKGDRVVALTFVGGMAEQVIVAPNRAWKIDRKMLAAEAAALLTTYATAYLALVTRAELRAGETIFVFGAGGGIGLAVVDLANALGARVIAGASSSEKVQAAMRQGADRGLVYPLQNISDGDPPTFDLAGALGRDRPDIIVDPVGGWTVEPALRAIAWRGRFLVVGFLGGIAPVPLELLQRKEVDLVGVALGAFARRLPERYRAIVASLLQFYRAQRLHPLVSERFRLEQGAEAFSRLATRQSIGKIVITTANPS